MKYTRLWIMAMVAGMAVCTFADLAPAYQIAEAGNLAEGALQQTPDKLPAENVDGTKANTKTHNAAAKIIKEFNDASQADLMGAAVQALAKFEELHTQDPVYLPAMTWIGYLATVTGNQVRSIEVLEAIRGKSSDQKVNLMNLRNLCAAYYATQDYRKAAGALVELDSQEPGNPTTLSLLGSSYVLDKDYRSAIAPLESAAGYLANDPDSLRNVRVDLGICYARTNQQEKAMRLFDSMLDDGGLTATQLGWMGYIYLENKKYGQAINALERANKMDPTNATVVNNLATAYIERGQSGDEAKAVSLFETLAGMSSGNPVADYNVGTIYLKKGEYAKAKTYLSRAAKSNDPYALNNLGMAHEGLKEDKEALAAYAKASDLRPDVVVFSRNAGFAAVRVKDDNSAVKYLSRASASDKSAEVLIPLAGVYSRTGQGTKALDIWTMPEVREKLKGDADYWFNLGLAHAGAGQMKEAAAAYRQSLLIKPGNGAVLNNLGALLWDSGDYAGARDAFERQSKLEPENETAKMNIAACYVKEGNIDGAVAIWRDVVRAHPDRTDVRLDLADGLWNTGDTPGARFHYATALKSQPNNPRALNGLGMWALLQTQNDEAESYFRKAVSADRKFIPAYQNLAIVLERKNKLAEAVKTLEAALSMDPDNEAVKQHLARLKSL